MEIDTADMLNLKSSLKQQDRIRAGRGRTDSAVLLHDGLESSNIAPVIDPIQEVDHGHKGDDEGDHMSPIMKFNETEEYDREAPLRLAAVVPPECHVLGGEDAPLGGQMSSTVSKTLNTRKQASLIRKRGYSDVDQNNLQALKLNTEASLHKELDRKIKELRQNTSKDKQAAKRVPTFPSEITGEIEFKEITGRRNNNLLNKKPAKEQVALAKDVDSSSSGSGSHADLDLSIFKGFEYSAEASKKMVASSAQAVQALQREIDAYSAK